MVLLGTQRVEISRDCFANLVKPNLRTLDLLYDQGEATSEAWSAYVLFDYGDPAEGRSVRISITEGKVDGRVLYGPEEIVLEPPLGSKPGSGPACSGR